MEKTRYTRYTFAVSGRGPVRLQSLDFFTITKTEGFQGPMALGGVRGRALGKNGVRGRALGKNGVRGRALGKNKIPGRATRGRLSIKDIS